MIVSSVMRKGSWFVFFFFSGRRRHTRSLCDWSSDVCSSDLRFHFRVPRRRVTKPSRVIKAAISLPFVREAVGRGDAEPDGQLVLQERRGEKEVRQKLPRIARLGRSEERRVGKELKSRRAAYR